MVFKAISHMANCSTYIMLYLTKINVFIYKLFLFHIPTQFVINNEKTFLSGEFEKVVKKVVANHVGDVW